MTAIVEHSRGWWRLRAERARKAILLADAKHDQTRVVIDCGRLVRVLRYVPEVWR